MKVTDTSFDEAENDSAPTSYNQWLYGIVRSSFGTLSMSDLLRYDSELRELFDAITVERNGKRHFSSKFDRALVEANIRRAFCAKRGFETSEEQIPRTASLLNISNFTTRVDTAEPEAYFPDQGTVHRIVDDDAGKLKVPAQLAETIANLEELGQMKMVEELKRQHSSYPNKDRSFHYLPYRTDSGFEQKFLGEVLTFGEVEQLGLEVYYNGDDTLTEFKIMCYHKSCGKWQYVGMYTPDFLIIQRRDGHIHKAIIVETKGKLYANDPKFKKKREFMETTFTKMNNKAFGYERFEYLYLEDALPENTRLSLTHDKICEFFGS